MADHQAYANRPKPALNFAMQSRLAQDGIRFAQARTVLPICTPARASMLTGRYPHAHGITENDGRFGGRAEIEDTDWLIHHPFARAGYRCGWFGKWHLNSTKSALDYGFEGFSLSGYGYPYATTAYSDYLDRHNLPPPIVEIELAGESGRPAGSRIPLCDENNWYDFESGTAILQGPAETHEAYFLADLAKNWIEQQRDQPFFLRIDPWGPHPPYMTAPPFQDNVATGSNAHTLNFGSDLDHRPKHHRDYQDYWASTLGIDEQQWHLMAQRSLEQAALVEMAMAGVLDTLEASGHAANTVVIYCADHGDAVASNGGVANKGGLMVEETLRIPMLMSGPGIQRGSVSEQLVANIDIAPTLLSLCELPARDDIQGKDLAPLFVDPDQPVRDGLMVQHYGLHEPIVQRAFYQGTWKLIVQPDGFLELYNLASDPTELTNMGADPRYKDRLHHMVSALRSEMHRTGDTVHAKASVLNTVNLQIR